MVYDVGTHILVNALDWLWVVDGEGVTKKVLTRVVSLANAMLGAMVLCNGPGDGID